MLEFLSFWVVIAVDWVGWVVNEWENFLFETVKSWRMSYLRIKFSPFQKTVWVRALTKTRRPCMYLLNRSASMKAIFGCGWGGIDCLVYSGVRLLTKLNNKTRRRLQRLRLSNSCPSSLCSSPERYLSVHQLLVMQQRIGRIQVFHKMIKCEISLYLDFVTRM